MAAVQFPDALTREMDVLPRGLFRPSAEARHRDRIPDKRLTDLRHENRPYVFPHYATRAQWLARAEELRRQVLVSAGLCPMPERPGLKPVVTRSLRRDDYVIENVCFETLPGFYVTGNLYRPAEVRGNIPGIANPHGHWKEGRFGDGFGNPIATRCIHFAKQGCAAFSYDMVGYGDRQAVSHQYRSLRGDLWGITLLGLQLWNSIRVLDYLASLPYVDPERLGCTGASGGGTQTFLLTAVDERVKVAAPVNMISAHMQGGCLCENAPNLRTDSFNVEFGACMAPRPLLLVSCTGDWTRNTPQVEYPAIRGIYELFGTGERVRCVQIEADHNYNRESREAVYAWFARWLLDRPEGEAAYRETPVQTERTEDLRVTPEGTALPGLADEVALEDAWTSRSEAQLASFFPKRRESGGQSIWNSGTQEGPSSFPDFLSSRLQEVARFQDEFRLPFQQMLGLRVPLPQDLRAEVRGTVEGESGGVRYGLHKLLLGEKDRGEAIPTLRLAPLASGGGVPVVMAHGDGKRAWARGEDGGAVWERVAAWLREGREGFFVDPWLTGEYHDPARRVGRAEDLKFFTTYNRADAALRAQDLVTACVYARGVMGAPGVDLWARGDAGLWALLTRPFIPGLGRTLIEGRGYALEDDNYILERCYAPGLRRLGGFRTAAILAAPAPLRVAGLDGAFGAFLRRLYGMMGAEKDLTLGLSS